MPSSLEFTRRVIWPCSRLIRPTCPRSRWRDRKICAWGKWFWRVAVQGDSTKGGNYVEREARVNPGNSGGPLVDMNGYVVGINTFILSQSGGSEGLGFAIPARVVNFVYHSLRKYGHVHHVEIGAGAQEITPTLAEGLGLPQSWGVIVADVTPAGPAGAAGVQGQDLILAAAGRPSETLSALSAATFLHNPDKPVNLAILRGRDANKQ